MTIKNNSEFIFLFQAAMTNPNGDPDQENKPRMDYETSTLLVSDARRKRDCRDYLKEKGFQIFVDTLADKKVPMDKMFEEIISTVLNDGNKLIELKNEIPQLASVWILGGNPEEFKKEYEKVKKDKSKKQEYTDFNNILLTEIIKSALVDIRLFGSAMAVEGVSRTFTGPIQMNWGYSLHPVELVKSNTITSIMNDDNSTFGKKHKAHYALVAHHGTVNKFSAKKTGMTENDLAIFRKALVQGMMNKQTDSKQGQIPLLYLEIKYSAGFDGYLGDLRRFIDVDYDEKKPIRSIEDLKRIDVSRLTDVIDELEAKSYIEKIMAWADPFINKDTISGMPEFESIDLWEEIK